MLFSTPLYNRYMYCYGLVTLFHACNVTYNCLHADTLHAECMRNILAAISYDDLVALLEKSRDESLSSTGGIDEDADGAYVCLPPSLSLSLPLSLSLSPSCLHDCVVD